MSGAASRFLCEGVLDATHEVPEAACVQVLCDVASGVLAQAVSGWAYTKTRRVILCALRMKIIGLASSVFVTVVVLVVVLVRVVLLDLRISFNGSLGSNQGCRTSGRVLQASGRGEGGDEGNAANASDEGCLRVLHDSKRIEYRCE